MFKVKRFYILFLCSLVVGFTAFAARANAILENKNKELIRSYIKRHNLVQLNELELQQLSWINSDDYHSNEMSVVIKEEKGSLNMEILRALTRIYCLHLLRSGTNSDYKKFIKPQTQHQNQRPVLSYKSFKEISYQVQKLTPEAFAAVKVATVLSSMAYSPKARKLAENILGKNNLPPDRVEFLATVANQALEIFPLGMDLVSRTPVANKYLRAAFSHNMHLRHMIYAEGGIGMFKTLREQIKLRYMTKEKLNVWYVYWVINICGFRGHLNQHGSIYLTDNVYQAVAKLKGLVDHMFVEPNFNPLEPYLRYRAELLGLDKSDPHMLFMGQFGSMLRLYTKAEGEALWKGLFQLPAWQRQKLSKQLSLMLVDYEILAPTYVPTMLANALAYSKSVEHTIGTMVPIYLQAVMEHRNLCKQGKIDPKIKLSFNDVANKKVIEQLFNVKAGDKFSLKIAANGRVGLVF